MGASLDARIGFLGAGALLAVAVTLLRVLLDPDRASNSAPVAFWVADRDGCAVYGLDEDLLLARRVRIEWPTAVVARPDRGVWVLRSSSGSPAGVARLLRLDSEGAIRSEVVFRGGASLEAIHEDSAIVLEGDDRVLRCDDTGRVEILYRGRALTCVAGTKDSILVGDARGMLVCVSLDPLGGVMRSVDLGEAVADVESGTWALTKSDRATIHRLEDDLAVRWSAGAGSLATRLASDQDPRTVWLVDESQSVIRRLGDHGVVELETRALPIVGPNGAVRTTSGGLAAISAGCVVFLDSTGSARPGQGGFGHLVDIDRVP